MKRGPTLRIGRPPRMTWQTRAFEAIGITANAALGVLVALLIGINGGPL